MTNPSAPTKTARLTQLLKARRGVSLTRLCTELGWRPHSVRAAISGLRKSGIDIERLPSKSAKGGPVYRIARAPEATA